MLTFFIGIIFIGFTVYAILPFSWALDWSENVIYVLQGGAPILSALLGLILMNLGIANYKDQRESKKSDSAN